MGVLVGLVSFVGSGALEVVLDVVDVVLDSVFVEVLLEVVVVVLVEEVDVVVVVAAAAVVEDLRMRAGQRFED